jgi:hypothetical protein
MKEIFRHLRDIYEHEKTGSDFWQEILHDSNEGDLQKPARHMNMRKPVLFSGRRFYMIMKIFRNLRGI